MSAPTLFDAPAERGASRHDGPQTSRDAGRSLEGHLRDQQALVLEAVAARQSGANAHEVQTWLRSRGREAPERNAIGSRFAELIEMGMVEPAGERPGRTGRMQHVVVVTERGAAWAAERWAS